jgi:hypothetical protein
MQEIILFYGKKKDHFLYSLYELNYKIYYFQLDELQQEENTLNVKNIYVKKELDLFRKLNQKYKVNKNDLALDLFLWFIDQIQPTKIYLSHEPSVLQQVISVIPDKYPLYSIIHFKYQNTNVDWIQKKSKQLFANSYIWNIDKIIPPSIPVIKNKTHKKNNEIIIWNDCDNLWISGIDLTIKIFSLQLVLSGEKNDYSIENIIQVECLRQKINLEEIQKKIRIEKRNESLFDSDIYLNTSYGEQDYLWNLIGLELNKPQVVPAIGILKEKIKHAIIPKYKMVVPKHMDVMGGTMQVCSPEDYIRVLEKIIIELRKN